MASIALIGPDGAGKTTVARALEACTEVPIRYLYMGVNTEASNIALPTTRLGVLFKRRLGEPRAATAGARRGGRRRWTSTLRATVRHLNMLADEWYRQLVSWYYQARGHVVVYDRYFLFDYSRHLRVEGQDRKSFRFHRFVLEKLYPRPTKVIYLDAPAEVLYSRKREGTLESLEARRRAFLSQGRELANFVCIDATQPLSEVASEVAAHIDQIAGRRPSCRFREQSS
jgi:thymidylate kinase